MYEAETYSTNMGTNVKAYGDQMSRQYPHMYNTYSTSMSKDFNQTYDITSSYSYNNYSPCAMANNHSFDANSYRESDKRYSVKNSSDTSGQSVSCGNTCQINENNRLNATSVLSITPDYRAIYAESKFEQLVREENEYEEDVDEEFSDEESMKQIDDEEAKTSKMDDVTKRLLKFAENVSGDIKRFFGSRKDEDSCDIFQDKWTSGKSGREMYYADIMRIAQGGDREDADSPKCGDEGKENRNHTGRMDKSVGLGPLEALFDPINGGKSKERKGSKKSVKRLQSQEGRLKIPMQMRKLPESFWSEPVILKTQSQNMNETNQRQKGNDSPKHPEHPDFNDLLSSWGRNDNTGVH